MGSIGFTVTLPLSPLRVVKDSNTKKVSIASTVLEVQAKVVWKQPFSMGRINYDGVFFTGRRGHGVSKPHPPHSDILLPHH